MIELAATFTSQIKSLELPDPFLWVMNPKIPDKCNNKEATNRSKLYMKYGEQVDEVLRRIRSTLGIAIT